VENLVRSRIPESLSLYREVVDELRRHGAAAAPDLPLACLDELQREYTTRPEVVASAKANDRDIGAMPRLGAAEPN
jgi:hypothetical protein